ncbi:MAG: GNAT family N-acetyltransferase [Gammaproteobacteria bacterium]|nr:GNAT family N-acetyltransferase [Gammaproteobacteria bacterium]
MSLTLRSFDVTDRASIKKFIIVPWDIYKDDPNWVPPLIKERLDLLSPKHPYFEHAQARFWIAYHGSSAVGRISAQIDQMKSINDHESVGYFGMFECIDDTSIAGELFAEAERWIAAHQCALIRGPFSLSINQECGLLIEGFDTPPYIMMGHAKPYYQELLMNHEYRKAKDLYAWHNQSEFTDPPAMERLVERYQDRIVMRDVNKKQVDRDINILMEVFNDSWANNWGFIPFTANEFIHLGKEMLRLIPASHFKIAELDGEPVGMIAGLPNFNQIIKDLNGKLLFSGVFKFLWRLKFSPPTTGRVALLGIKQEYQNQLVGSALAFMLISKIKEVAYETGVTEHEMSWVLEDNKRLNKILESLGASRYKTYRIFEKRLLSQS